MLILILAISKTAIATMQEPDILRYSNLKLSLSTGWGHPSPLETYYYQNSIDYPFSMLSTANYRGHVAVWKIYKDKLYLTEIRIDKSFEPQNFKVYKPQDFDVRSMSSPPLKDDEVFADWFSGILECHTGYKIGHTKYYYFHVRNGLVIGHEIVTQQDQQKIRNTSNKKDLSDELKSKLKMLTLNENYIAYYYRLHEEDTIKHKQKIDLLGTGSKGLSPILAFYDNNHLKWPYNWENMEKSGAPHCKWLIKDNKLYLTSVELYSGLKFDSVDKEKIELTTLFKEKAQNGVVYADWVSGVYLIKPESESIFGDASKQKDNKSMESTIVRIKDGLLIESFTVPSDFDIDKMPGDINPKLKQIIEDYK